MIEHITIGSTASAEKISVMFVFCRQLVEKGKYLRNILKDVTLVHCK